ERLDERHGRRHTAQHAGAARRDEPSALAGIDWLVTHGVPRKTFFVREAQGQPEILTDASRGSSLRRVGEPPGARGRPPARPGAPVALTCGPAGEYSGREPRGRRGGKAMSFGSEFRQFAMKGNVVDLAVGVII